MLIKWKSCKSLIKKTKTKTSVLIKWKHMSPQLQKFPPPVFQMEKKRPQSPSLISTLRTILKSNYLTAHALFHRGRQDWQNFDLKSTLVTSMNNSLSWLWSGKGMAPISLGLISTWCIISLKELKLSLVSDSKYWQNWSEARSILLRACIWNEKETTPIYCLISTWSVILYSN